MARGIALADIHPAVEAGVNNQDLDALLALYEPDASMVRLDGSTARRPPARRPSAGDQSLSAVTAEVARRQLDGGWLYVVDHSFASMQDPSPLSGVLSAG